MLVSTEDYTQHSALLLTLPHNKYILLKVPKSFTDYSCYKRCHCFSLLPVCLSLSNVATFFEGALSLLQAFFNAKWEFSHNAIAVMVTRRGGSCSPLEA